MPFHQTLASIDHLSKDSKSGAAEIEKKAIMYINQLVTEISPRDNLKNLKNIIETVSIKLVQAQPSMAPLFNLGNTALLLSNSAQSTQELKEALSSHFTSYNSTENLLIRNAAKIISSNATIVTHSRSSTIAHILKEYSKGLKVICTESGPLKEGRRLARELSCYGIQVTLVADAAIFSFLKTATFILVGADAITPQGVINKIGTMAIASVAKDFGLPFYVGATLHKLYPLPLKIEDRNPSVVWVHPPHNVQVKNVYFDTTPLCHVDTFITEKGLYSAESIKKKIATLKIAPQLLDFLKKSYFC